jgi:hypothetical protein
MGERLMRLRAAHHPMRMIRGWSLLPPLRETPTVGGCLAIAFAHSQACRSSRKQRSVPAEVARVRTASSKPGAAQLAVQRAAPPSRLARENRAIGPDNHSC